MCVCVIVWVGVCIQSRVYVWTLCFVEGNGDGDWGNECGRGRIAMDADILLYHLGIGGAGCRMDAAACAKDGRRKRRHAEFIVKTRTQTSTLPRRARRHQENKKKKRKKEKKRRESHVQCRFGPVCPSPLSLLSYRGGAAHASETEAEAEAHGPRAAGG